MVYAIELIDDDGYNTNFTVNTQNSEGTYLLPSGCNAHSAVYDVTDDVNSNEEILEGSQYDLNVNAAEATKGKGILRQKGQQKQLQKSSEMPVGLIVKMIATN